MSRPPRHDRPAAACVSGEGGALVAGDDGFEKSRKRVAAHQLLVDPRFPLAICAPSSRAAPAKSPVKNSAWPRPAWISRVLACRRRARAANGRPPRRSGACSKHTSPRPKAASPRARIMLQRRRKGALGVGRIGKRVGDQGKAKPAARKARFQRDDALENRARFGQWPLACKVEARSSHRAASSGARAAAVARTTLAVSGLPIDHCVRPKRRSAFGRRRALQEERLERGAGRPPDGDAIGDLGGVEPRNDRGRSAAAARVGANSPTLGREWRRLSSQAAPPRRNSANRTLECVADETLLDMAFSNGGAGGARLEADGGVPDWRGPDFLWVRSATRRMDRRR